MSAARNTKPAKAAPPGGEGATYYASAVGWAEEIDRANERAARFWMRVSAALGAALALALFAIAALAPFKTVVPYVITVDQHGRIEAARTPTDGAITQNEAVVESLVAQYVIARETYDPYDVTKRYHLVMLMSHGLAEESFKEMWSPSNPERPSDIFGRDGRVEVQISAITVIDEGDSVNVRFTKRLSMPNRGTQTVSYNAVVGYRFRPRTMSLEDLWRNPLGFEVVSYRVAEER